MEKTSFIHAIVTVLAAMSFLMIIVSGQAAIEIYYVYNFAEDGIALVRVIVSSNQSLNTIIVNLEKNFDEATIAVYDDRGNPYPYIVRNNTLLVEAGNSTKIIIEYVAMPSTILDIGTYRIVLHPEGPSTIYLPADAAIVSFTGAPQILVQNNRITLVYSSPGNYTIEYIIVSELFRELPPPEEPTETTPTNITTTTPTTTTTINTTTNTSTVPQPAIHTPHNTTTQLQQTNTTKPTETSTPPQIPQTKTTTEKQTPTSPPQSTTPSIEATETETKTNTTSTPSEADKTTTIVALVVLAITIIGLVYILYKKKPSSTGGEALEVIKIEDRLDERDRAILDLLKETEYVGVSEVARKLNISKSTAWRKLQRLVEMGLIERKISKDGNPVYSLSRREKRENQL